MIASVNYMEEYMAMLSQEIGKPIPILKKGYSQPTTTNQQINFKAHSC